MTVETVGKVETMVIIETIMIDEMAIVATTVATNKTKIKMV